MWPWEHLAIGYLALSVSTHGVYGRRPGATEVLTVAVGTQFPDLVDKPLGWGLGILPSGTSLAHSLLFALPFVAVVGAIAHRYDRPQLALAFGIGYLFHLPADVAYGLLLYGNPHYGFLLWPLIPSNPTSTAGLVSQSSELFAKFVRALQTPAGKRFLVMEMALLGAAFSVWLFDGRPGLELFGREQ